MAAARKTKKPAAAKKTAAKKPAAKAAKKDSEASRLMEVCLIVIYWALAIITMFKFGTVGTWLYGLLSLIFGSFTIILLLGGMFFTFSYIWTGGKDRLNARFWWGVGFLALSWCMIAALPSLPADNAWQAFTDLDMISWAVFEGRAFSWYGLIGALGVGVFASLFGKAGAWVVAVALCIIGLLFTSFQTLQSFFRMLQASGKSAREKSKVRHAQNKQKKAARKAAAAAKASQPAVQAVNPAAAPMETSQVKFSFEKEQFDFGKATGFHEPVQEAPKPKRHSLLDEDYLSDGPASTSVGQSSLQDPAKELNAEKKTLLGSGSKLKKDKKEKPSRSRPKPAPEPEEDIKNGTDHEALPAAISTDTSNYVLPKISLLNDPGKAKTNSANAMQARTDQDKLLNLLSQFGIQATMSDIHIGPSVTKFEITPGTGVRVNSITNLQNDIKMALAATDIRIEAPIPGKSAIGIEVPNVEKMEVSMRDLLRSIPNRLQNLPLVFALGKDLTGQNVYGRLDTMPHLLIAGATGSGKSVCVNAIISSILMRTKPDDVKLVLIDPKKVEFTPYNGVPHLLAPVITDGDLANKALQLVVAMMDRRYDLFEEAMVRNITAYNAYVDQNPDTHLQKLPRIVVIIDELADLMLAAAKEVEQSIQRITQLARAAGIHLIVATQRPSVNVITGVIKANIPSRIAFAVSSAVDSRTILDQSGAERLLGYGDMLFLDNGDTAPRRIQGVFIKDEEVMRICEYVKSQAAPAYDDAFITMKEIQSQGGPVAKQDLDPLYEEIKHFVITSRKASTSLIQRRFSIGYGRAARVLDTLEANGIVGPSQGSKAREILVPAPDLMEDDLY